MSRFIFHLLFMFAELVLPSPMHSMTYLWHTKAHLLIPTSESGPFANHRHYTNIPETSAGCSGKALDLCVRNMTCLLKSFPPATCTPLTTSPRIAIIQAQATRHPKLSLRLNLESLARVSRTHRVPLSLWLLQEPQQRSL